MEALRTLPADARVPAALIAAGLTGLTLLVAQRLGVVALGVPFAALGAIALLRKPALTLAILLSLLIMVEPEEGIFPFVRNVIYRPLISDLQVIDLLLGLAVLAVLLDLLARELAPRLPVALLSIIVLVGAALASGILIGSMRGTGLTDMVFAAKPIVYLLVIPLLIVNVVRTEEEVNRVLVFVAALAIAKALTGFAGIATGSGVVVGGATITFYEPTGNFLTLAVALGVIAMLFSGARVPRPILLGTPLLVVCILLSYRRSFWIGAVLGLTLVVLLGLSTVGRRLLLPTVSLLALAIYLLTASGFQLSGPLAERAESLRPSAIQQSKDDRYRFDERANVAGEIRRHPITGLGLGVRWRAVDRPLAVEHGKRQYVHFAFLWWWLRLGALGAAAYAFVMLVAIYLSARLWQRSHNPLKRALGLGALATVIALAVIETSATFLGVDERYTATFGGMLGLLLVLSRGRDDPPPLPA